MNSAISQNVKFSIWRVFREIMRRQECGAKNLKMDRISLLWKAAATVTTTVEGSLQMEIGKINSHETGSHRELLISSFHLIH